MSEYQRPQPRKGMICWYAQWDKAGKLVQTLYRKPRAIESTQAESLHPSPQPIKRGIKAERQIQGNLL